MLRTAGAYGYPVSLAARIALQTVLAFLQAQSTPALVRFVLFDAGTYEAYAAVLGELLLPRGTESGGCYGLGSR